MLLVNPFVSALNRLLWKDKTRPAHSYLIMSWETISDNSVLVVNVVLIVLESTEVLRNSDICGPATLLSL